MADGPAINDISLDVSSVKCKGSHVEKSTKKSQMSRNHAQRSSGQAVTLARCKVGLDMAKPPRETLSVLLRSGDGRVVSTNQQEEIGKEATVEAPSAQTRKDDTSRPGALSRFFRMSRDGWKSKYKDLKATVKGYKNRLAHLARSREQWRIRAERAGEQITTLEVEIAELTTDY